MSVRPFVGGTQFSLACELLQSTSQVRGCKRVDMPALIPQLHVDNLLIVKEVNPTGDLEPGMSELLIGRSDNQPAGHLGMIFACDFEKPGKAPMAILGGGRER